MTLIGAIIKKVQSKDSLMTRKYSSPPPELDEGVIEKRIHKKRKKPLNRYPDVGARVDSSPPPMRPAYMFRNLEDWRNRLATLYEENVKLLTEIKRQHFLRGKVDCRWKRPMKPWTEFYEKRRNFAKRVETDNRLFYKRLIATEARVCTTQSLNREWRHNRQKIIDAAAFPFILFPQVVREEIAEVFIAPLGVKRPRVKMSLRVQNGAAIGSLTLELFTDVCPLTCRLFTELLHGDSVGHSYVGTSFFRKVPSLYWSGGDVIYDNGFGCYAQAGRQAPIGAENYHFPHSMPGLLSMRTTRNDEVCGIFNITFKALPQFDLKNVVFGRVIRPSTTYYIMSGLGSPLSTQPVVRVAARPVRHSRACRQGTLRSKPLA